MAAKTESVDQALRLNGVSVFAAADTECPIPLIEDVELSLRPGEWLNLAGVNGSGKSTLARLLAGLHVEGASGHIDRGFAGHGVSPIVLQRPESQLFGETPLEEVLFALEWRQTPPGQMKAWSDQALRSVGLPDMADYRWDRLSGGQRQLAAVAAAATGGASLIVFDEATSMLDDVHRRAVLGIAREMQRQGASVVWVTQRLDELLPDDRIVAMAGGGIRYDGDVRTFLYGDAGDRPTPCESCGLRLPYLAVLALELKKRGRLNDPLPVTDAEWREVWGHANADASRG